MPLSDEAETQTRGRGRPRKIQSTFKFKPPVYLSPLGYQYSQPILFSIFTQPPPQVNEDEFYREPNKTKRSAAIKGVQAYKKRKKQFKDEESTLSEEIEDVETSETDNYEKLLDRIEDESGVRYLIKFRNLSYLHCDWVDEDEITKTRTGAMKVKRYKYIGLDENYTIIDRVLLETNNTSSSALQSNEHTVLIKWKGLSHEHSTFELVSDIVNCKNFDEELAKFRDRKKMRHMKYPIEWRPSKDRQLKFDKSPEYKKNNVLRAYQLEGLNWLLNRWYFKQSCIMADEMGLGKTVQSVSFINSLYENFDYYTPTLIVAPLSTIGHWEREFANWTNLRVLTYHGSIPGREVISNYEFNLKSGNINVRLFDVIITTYEMVMAGVDHLNIFQYGVGIFDEAHRLKNPNSKAATCLKSLDIYHKVLLSGTPIQNNLNELWALFNFIDPYRFNSLQHFLGEYKMENASDVDKLQQLLKPLMLRRMKEDVETSIPSKEETIIEVELTLIQKRYYRAILEKNLEFLAKGDKGNAPNLMNAMMELRKCCIHPYLLKGAEESIIEDYNARKSVSLRHSKNTLRTSTLTTMMPSSNLLKFPNANELNGEDEDEIKYDRSNPSSIVNIDEYYDVLIHSSGKLVLLDKLLNKLHGQHKVLIFSQMTKCLDLLAEYLQYRKFKYERIDGGVRGDLRQAAIDRFSTGDAFVFLLCTRAGGVGINLTAADTCIIFDSDWNPQNDLQAQARCHRIGQKNQVKIYRLITKNSYEREMFDKAGMKLGLDRAVLQKMSFSDQQVEKTNRKEDAIQLLLRKGAYGVLMDTDDAANKFCEEDIDQILERRTKVIKHEDGGNAFSKATFQVEKEIEDPHFWENLLSQKKNEEKEGRVKRQCRKLAREGNISDINEVENLYRYYTGGIVTDYSTSSGDLYISLNEEEKTLFVLFLDILVNGLNNLDFDIYSSDLDPKSNKLGQIVKYCIDSIQNEKTKMDFMAYVEKFNVEYDFELFEKQSSIYLKYHEPFLFRIQVPLIVHSLYEPNFTIEKARGFSCEDDRTIMQRLLKHGYGNFTIREKNVEEVNQRVRKIITVLYHRNEVKENDNMYFKTILNFGRITDYNESNVKHYLNGDVSKLNDLIDRIYGMSRRARKDTSEADCYDRIVFFDKLLHLKKIYPIRKQQMPKDWDEADDESLKVFLLTDGFCNLYNQFQLTEDVVIKRFEHMFKLASNKDDSLE